MNPCGYITLRFEDKIKIEVTCGDDLLESGCGGVSNRIWTLQFSEKGIVIYCNRYEILFGWVASNGGQLSAADIFGVRQCPPRTLTDTKMSAEDIASAD